METVGQRIKRLRKERKWTQEMLGAKLGVKKAAVQKYESGRVVNLKQETIKKLSEVFEVPATTFIDYDEWDKYAKDNNLAEQVKLIDMFQIHFGSDAVKLMYLYMELHKADKEDLLRHAEEIYAITQKRTN